jgi:hypothetical protein
VSFQILQDCGLGDQQPVPETDMADAPLSYKLVHRAMRHPEFCGQLAAGIMLLNHCPILQAINANAAAGPRAHSASQVQVM